jgi:hypothetical protein
MVASLLAASAPLEAQWLLQAQVGAEDKQPEGQVGLAVSIEGDTIAVGAPRDDEAGLNAGAAYVYVESGGYWSQQAKLIGLAGPQDFTGGALALSGDTLLVGAHRGGAVASGLCYTFVQSGETWTLQAMLKGSQVTKNDAFGKSVDLQGDTAAIGDPEEGVNAASRTGAAYIYSRTGTLWSEDTLLLASDAQPDDDFGWAVALDGDTLAVGAPLDDNAAGPHAGAAYIFVRTGTDWTEQAKLIASDASGEDRFGYSIALHGETVVVGAESDSHGPEFDAGSAYVFVRSGTTWSEQAQLTATNPKASDLFGSSLSLDADRLAVGARGDKVAGQNLAGSVHVFERSGTVWSLTQHLKETNPTFNNGFGNALALSSERIAVGCGGAEYHGTPNAGAAYVFGDQSPFTSYCTAGTSALGCTASVSASGLPSAGAPSGFHLSATGVEGDKSGSFLYGTGAQQALAWGTGTSYRCFGAPFFRGTLQAASGTPGLCDGAFAEDLNARWCASCPRPSHNPGAGATMRGQLWYRDAFNTGSRPSSLSDAVEWVVGL